MMLIHLFVMAGLVPAIHVFFQGHIIQDVDARDFQAETRFALLRGHEERDHSSALNGRVSRPSIAASIVILPARIAATACDTGISTFCEAASSIKTGAVKAPSASLPCCGASLRPSAMPSAKLRDCGLEQVRITSPRPERPDSVSLRAPQARPSRAS